MDSQRELFHTPTFVHLAERVGFEPTCRSYRQTDFEFYRRLLITWFLLSVSVSLVRPQTRMKSGLFEKIARKYGGIAHRFQSAIFPLLERTAERTERTKIKRQYTDSSNTGKAYQDMRCIVMKENAINWDAVPDVITKDQLYRIAISANPPPCICSRVGKSPASTRAGKPCCYKNQKGGCDCLSGKP